MSESLVRTLPETALSSATVAVSATTVGPSLTAASVIWSLAVEVKVVPSTNV